MSEIMRPKAEIIAEVVRSRRQARADWRVVARVVTRDNALARSWRAAKGKPRPVSSFVVHFLAATSWGFLRGGGA